MEDLKLAYQHLGGILSQLGSKTKDVFVTLLMERGEIVDIARSNVVAAGVILPPKLLLVASNQIFSAIGSKHDFKSNAYQGSIIASISLHI